jgi:tyrosyl-tRNA synthetase
VHSEEALKGVEEASQILFGKATTEALRRLDEQTLLSVFDGVPTVSIQKSKLNEGLDIVDFLATKTEIFPSKGEARRMLKDNGLSINKQKVNDAYQITSSDLLNDRYILVQKGKKNYYLVIAE